MFPFDALQFSQQLVVLGVRQRRIIQDKIVIVRLFDLMAQLRYVGGEQFFIACPGVLKRSFSFTSGWLSNWADSGVISGIANSPGAYLHNFIEYFGNSSEGIL